MPAQQPVLLYNLQERVKPVQKQLLHFFSLQAPASLPTARFCPRCEQVRYVLIGGLATKNPPLLTGYAFSWEMDSEKISILIFPLAGFVLVSENKYRASQYFVDHSSQHRGIIDN